MAEGESSQPNHQHQEGTDRKHGVISESSAEAQNSILAELVKCALQDGPGFFQIHVSTLSIRLLAGFLPSAALDRARVQILAAAGPIPRHLGFQDSPGWSGNPSPRTGVHQA